jgi:hypothetical protein
VNVLLSVNIWLLLATVASQRRLTSIPPTKQ